MTSREASIKEESTPDNDVTKTDKGFRSQKLGPYFSGSTSSSSGEIPQSSGVKWGNAEEECEVVSTDSGFKSHASHSTVHSLPETQQSRIGSLPQNTQGFEWFGSFWNTGNMSLGSLGSLGMVHPLPETQQFRIGSLPQNAQGVKWGNAEEEEECEVVSTDSDDDCIGFQSQALPETQQSRIGFLPQSAQGIVCKP
ncbi:hypothetical protein V1264_002689 [Littorina saxatilis]|uniref:Uncharacterized protein n=1 Tax=Littorina saxatilis TaxID=31220 RepID=A0AAN9B3E7_9CAEN